MLEGLDIVYKAVLLSGFVFSAISGLFFLVMNSRYVSKKTMDEHVETETKEFEKRTNGNELEINKPGKIKHKSTVTK